MSLNNCINLVESSITEKIKQYWKQERDRHRINDLFFICSPYIIHTIS